MTELTGRKILVVEDESLIALELENTLQDLGCEVIGPISRVDEIADCVESHAFDGALLDINLRGRQVFSALPVFLDRRIPVIITSGYDDSTLFPDAFRHLPRIAKPFDQAALRKLCIAVFATPG
jgi:DNA-binding NtrC family response regulator